MINKEEMDRVADTLMHVMMTGDVAKGEELFAPDCTAWFNALDQEISRGETLRLISMLSANFVGFNYQDIGRCYADDGYAQRHTVCGQTKDGRQFRVPACLFVTVRDGKIAYVRDYFDSAQDPLKLIGGSELRTSL